MSSRKKRNMAIGAVLVLLILPLYFLSIKMEQDLAEKEYQKNAQRRPAVQDADVMTRKQ